MVEAVLSHMRVLYIDDSGSLAASQKDILVYAGFSVPENAIPGLNEELCDLVHGLFPNAPENVELHGTEIQTGKKRWRNRLREERRHMMVDCLQLIAERNYIRVFAAVVDPTKYTGSQSVTESMFEQISSRFDQYLSRVRRKRGESNCGMILCDKTPSENAIQNYVAKFRENGHHWGSLHNMVDVPAFIDSKESRLIQLADLVAYSIHRFYRQGDSMYYNIIRDSFDRDERGIHGLWAAHV